MVARAFVAPFLKRSQKDIFNEAPLVRRHSRDPSAISRCSQAWATRSSRPTVATEMPITSEISYLIPRASDFIIKIEESLKRMRKNRPALFHGRHFEDEIIILCVR
jgi:hypothetical protein